MIRSFFFWLTLLIVTPLCAGACGLLFFWDAAFLLFARLWARLICAAAGVRVIRKDECPPPPGPAVYMFNHASNFDIFALCMHIPPRTRMVAKKQLGWIPIFGWALHLTGMVMVDRRNHTRAIKQMEKAAKVVHDGRPIFVSPEGTRSQTGELLPFKKGGFIIAIGAQAPIVPVIIHGAFGVQSRRAFRISPGDIHISFKTPIPTEGLTVADRDALIAKLRAVFIAELAKPPLA